MVYKIRYKKSVAKDLKSIDKGEKERILNKIEDTLSNKPNQYPLLKGRFAGLRKLRIGNYRVIFSLLDDEIWILRIGHRSEIYK
ncbi:MAG: type II toxin-antitoxin system RelE/ParE family toxin [Candidatus Marinimicrobia bacterium]|nr:type II toxin-antitoxin system RelE/ParE family toxin [Candidatus Neomarinimicrobiota bacterium]